MHCHRIDCECVTLVLETERHGIRMHVAMVAQDLVRFKIGTHSHNDIPSVHGSGAIGLKTVQSAYQRTRESRSGEPCTVIDT